MEPIEKGKIDLLDSEYKKQFSRVSVASNKQKRQHHTPHLSELSSHSKTTKSSSLDSTATDSTIVPGSGGGAMETVVEAKKEEDTSKNETVTTSIQVAETTKSELKEAPIEIPITIKNSAEVGLEKTSLFLCFFF